MGARSTLISLLFPRLYSFLCCSLCVLNDYIPTHAYLKVTNGRQCKWLRWPNTLETGVSCLLGGHHRAGKYMGVVEGEHGLGGGAGKLWTVHGQRKHDSDTELAGSFKSHGFSPYSLFIRFSLFFSAMLFWSNGLILKLFNQREGCGVCPFIWKCLNRGERKG